MSDLIERLEEARADLPAWASSLVGSAAARIRELEAHCNRLGQGGAERYWENRWRDADARIRELEEQVYLRHSGYLDMLRRAAKAEAERNQYKDDYLRRHKDVGDEMERRIAAEQRAEKAEAERDAIEAATIERCWQIAKAYEQEPNEEFRAKYPWREASEAIHALATPTLEAERDVLKKREQPLSGEIAKLRLELLAMTLERGAIRKRAEKAEAELAKIAQFIEPHARFDADQIIAAIGQLNTERDALEAERNE